MDIFITIAISLFTGTILALIGAFVGRLINKNATKEAVDMAFDKSIESLKRYEFIKTGNKFKTAFIDTKILLKEIYWYIPFEKHLSERIPIERRAVDDFLIFLPENKRIGIEEAWQNYRGKNDEDFSNEYLLTEEEIAEKPEIEKEVKAKILNRIAELEKFADPSFVFDK